MPPRLPRIASRQLRLSSKTESKAPPCLICQFSSAPAPTAKPQSRRALAPAGRTTTVSRRHASTASSDAVDISAPLGDELILEAKPLTPRQALSKLHSALQQLQYDAGAYTNISRIQLALRSIEACGSETTRIAIISLASQRNSARKARDLVRLLLADPLTEEEEWERVLLQQKGAVLVRIGANLPKLQEVEGQSRLVKELNISSPTWNGHKIEILVLDGKVLGRKEESVGDIADRLLTPLIDVPSNTGRFSALSTPVHKSLLVGDGILGASTLLHFPAALDTTIISSAVDLPGYQHEEDNSSAVQAVDIGLGAAALDIFRQSVQNAMDYECHWTSSNLPIIQEWVKSGTLPSATIKAPTAALISSILFNTTHRISKAEAKHLANLLQARVGKESTDQLIRDLTAWSEKAHTELRDSLDLAFAGPHWAGLSWWKLFWRVDDVSAIASDMISSRFLQASEDELIYLAGKVEASGVFAQPQVPEVAKPTQSHGFDLESNSHGGASWAYKEIPRIQTIEEEARTATAPSKGEERGNVIDPTPVDAPLEGAVALPAIKPSPWPLHIPITRRYLVSSSTLRLQALSQRLVAETYGTTFASCIASAALYAGVEGCGMYEAGAVAALGTVIGLGRMQKRWEGARKWWMGDIREEGRRSLLETENVVRDVLRKAAGDSPTLLNRELVVAKEAVSRAEEALAVLKATEVEGENYDS